MGDNEVRLVQGYLKLADELMKDDIRNDEHKAKLIKAKMDGIVFGYETYTAAHWSTFEHLLGRYHAYMSR